MKTTVDLPDPLFRRAKSTAAQRGVSLKCFITEAVEQKLAVPSSAVAPVVKPWIKAMESFPMIAKEALDEIDEIIAENRRRDLEMQREERAGD
jgi:hypothetical protein